MTKLAIKRTLQNADEICKATGSKLTAKRKRALTILLEAPGPISAYELIEEYKQRYKEPLTAMSAYRMLNFLVAETLAHKLLTVNKYAACEHINCDHAHHLPQFLICDNCESVEEVGIKKDTLDKLKNGIEQTGFTLNEQQLELHGLCRSCLPDVQSDS